MDMMFSKRLSQTDISNRLAIPTKSLPLFPPFRGGARGNEIVLEVWDDEEAVDGKILWKFICSTRKIGKYPKPVFSRGWLDFIRAKALSVGDEVRLYRTENTTKLFGNVVCQLRYSIEVVKGAEASETTSTVAATNSQIIA